MPMLKFTIPFFLCVLFWYHQVACKWDMHYSILGTYLRIWKYIIWILYTLAENDLVIQQNKACTINFLNLWSISNYIIIRRITRCQIMDGKSHVLKAEKVWQIQGCFMFSRSHLTESLGCHILVIITSWWSLPEDCHLMLSRKSHNNLPPQILMSCDSNSGAFSQWAEIVWILHQNLCW
jgi:hypothetical protein